MEKDERETSNSKSQQAPYISLSAALDLSNRSRTEKFPALNIDTDPASREGRRRDSNNNSSKQEIGYRTGGGGPVLQLEASAQKRERKNSKGL